MKTELKDNSLFYHYLDWALAHPRFGILMVVLTLLSFMHNQIIAAVLFLIFATEIGLRINIYIRQVRMNPYRDSIKRKIDMLFLIVDIIAVSSLLVTVFELQIAAEDIAFVRLMRAAYLLRSMRIFRYFDLHSAMFSPTYGMITSLVIMISFFASDILLWFIIFFFFIDLSLRLLIQRNMKFESKRDKTTEWAFWWIDLIATIFMLPVISTFPYSSALRILRLARLLKPWKIILRNLRDVLREGQFIQEINLIVLFLAILSITGGVISHFTLEDFDYAFGEHAAGPVHDLPAAIWFAFRLFTDPGNSIVYPESLIMAVYSILAVILGVFVFAFFIGIGANIVSGLMRRLRNEHLMLTNHLVILGWSAASPYIMTQLRNISSRTLVKLRVVLLHESETPPVELLTEKWVTYRHGNIEDETDLKRVNIPHAKQALLVLDEQGNSESLAHSFFNLLALRTLNRDIGLSFALPGMSEPRLKTHKHLLQVGWDNLGKYDKPTVVMSEADFKVNALCNVLRYSDFDQVLQRLLIPELLDESSLQMTDWQAKFIRNEAGGWDIRSQDGEHAADIQRVQSHMFMRGATLIAYINEDWETRPIYSLDEEYREEVEIKAILGLAISEQALHDELLFSIRHNGCEPAGEQNGDQAVVSIVRDDLDTLGLTLEEPEDKMQLLVIGWVGSLPLLLKRLLRFYHELDLVIVDDLQKKEAKHIQSYLKRRLAEEPGLEELVTIKIKSWQFFDMEFLRPYVATANHIILSRPQRQNDSAYAVTSTILSHMTTIIKDEDNATVQVFPIMENRAQAELLQTELSEFDLPAEVHVTVLNEFYGVYVAHTTFHMFSAVEDAHESKKALRRAVNKLMSDSGADSDLGLKTFHVSAALPDDAGKLFDDLKAAGYIWIGYTLKEPYEWSSPLQRGIQTVFPRPVSFSCQRQKHIFINPFGNPVSAKSWHEKRDEIATLITIGGDEDVELF